MNRYDIAKNPDAKDPLPSVEEAELKSAWSEKNPKKVKNPVNLRDSINGRRNGRLPVISEGEHSPNVEYALNRTIIRARAVPRRQLWKIYK